MSKLFCSINERDDDVWSMLPIFAALSDEIVFWCPSSYSIERSLSINPNSPSIKDVLSILKNGDVKFAIRPDWLDKKNRGEKIKARPDLKHLVWQDEFDGALADDLETLKQNGSVVALGDIGDFHEWAEEQIDINSDIAQIAGNHWEAGRKVGSRHKALPPGTVQRIEENFKKAPHKSELWHAKKGIIRDARLQEEILKRLDLDTPIYKLTDHFQAFSSVSQHPPIKLDDQYREIRLDELSDIIYELSIASKFRGPDQISAIKSNQDALRAFRQIVTSAGTNSRIEIEERIRHHLKNDKPLYTIFSEKRFIAQLIVVGIALDVYGAILNPATDYPKIDFSLKTLEDLVTYATNSRVGTFFSVCLALSPAMIRVWREFGYGNNPPYDKSIHTAALIAGADEGKFSNKVMQTVLSRYVGLQR